MSKRMYLGMLIASPGVAAFTTIEYWASDSATFVGWLEMVAVTTTVFWLVLTGVFVAMSKERP